MEKLDLLAFRTLKQKVIELIESLDYIKSTEEGEQIITEYKGVIKTLSEHDLSDIDFEEWRGMDLIAEDDIFIDFSRTNANIDFSIIEYSLHNNIPNFKSCHIKNYDFENYFYSSEMFDEEFISEHQDKFLSNTIPEDVSNRFYNGKLTLTDIQNNPELVNKVEEKNLGYKLREIYKILGMEEFQKLDAQFIDTTGNTWVEFLKSNPDLRTAEKIMPVLYKSAREYIIGESNPNFRYRQDQLGEKFREDNPDLFISEEAPEIVREHYYSKHLLIEEFSQNLQYFQGKMITQAFSSTSQFAPERRLINIYGEDLYQLYVDYEPIIDKLLTLPHFSILYDVPVPNEPLPEEQRKEIMHTVFTSFVNRDGLEKVTTWDEFKMLLDFISIDDIVMTTTKREFVEKYGIDKVIESGLDFKYIFKSERLTNLEEISNIKGIDFEDTKKLIDEEYTETLGKYSTTQLLEFGIRDLSELSKTTNDLNKIKEMLERMPIDLINMGINQIEKRAFIKKYGIENIIALDKETNGIFSHDSWGDDIYMSLFAMADRRTTEEELTYEQFKDRIYEILVQARGKNGLLALKWYPDYDFVQGKFREDHPDIFIDGNIPEDVKNAFYTRSMTAEMVRKNPELIQLLQGKDLSRAFAKTMEDVDDTVNMAQYLSERLGAENFLKICTEYGKCLDSINISISEDISLERLKETIEKILYIRIKENGIEYFEELPTSFKEAHPELFLPETINKEVRDKFYKGELSFEDIRQNPQIKELLLTKDLSVGFEKTRYGSIIVGGTGRHTNQLWETLSEKEILDFAEKYGKYFKCVDLEILKNGQSLEEIDKAVRENIEKKILTEEMKYDDTAPEFFRKKHPELFLRNDAPEMLKLSFYNGYVSKIEEFFNHSSSNYILRFEKLKENPEWQEFLKDKDLTFALPRTYKELLNKFDSATLLKIGPRYAETIKKMVENHKEDALENWYKSTGGRFIPHHVVMLNFPESEIDSFLSNSKKWSQLMRIENYNLNDDGKAAILKVAYAMGVFHGSDEGFNKTIKLFTDIPQELTENNYDSVKMVLFANGFHSSEANSTDKELFEESYTLNSNSKYVLVIDKQQNKENVKTLRAILEKAQIPQILTPEKAHQIFDSFAIDYNPDFVKFFSENINEIISNPEYSKDIATIQRQFRDIVRMNAGRRLTLEVAQDYVKSIVYSDIDIGNEGVAEQAKITGYSQTDFEAIQKLYNEGELREFSSIPRIQGTTNGYTYEMLRCDDPLALTIGTLTDCCQQIHGAGQTSMEHSVVSPDGRVFCVRDSEGRLVAQSWFWRNQYTGCFDNIEIPDRIFLLYDMKYPGSGRKRLTTEVLEVYKKAAQDLMQEDVRVYQELLENETITQEQYDALLLGKVTIGLGYNDIADAIKSDRTLHLEQDQVMVKGTNRLPNPYTDANTQYAIAEREGLVRSDQENLYVHQDDIPVYDGTNMTSTTFMTLRRMEQSAGKDNLSYIIERKDEEDLPKSQRIINGIAREYGFKTSDTHVIATARMAIIYSKDEYNNIKIGDLFSAPLKSELTEEQHQKATAHILHQVKKALKQIGIKDSEVDISSLSEDRKQMLQPIMQEIKNEKAERGDRKHG